MTAPPTTAGPPTVDVVRPSAGQQVAAGLATGAALVAVGTLGASLSTVRYTGEGEDAGSSVTRVAWGETLTGFSEEPFGYPSVPWGAPMVLVALLLTGAAVAALLASRAIVVERSAVVAQLLAVAGGSLAAGVLVVLWRVAAADLEAGETVEDLAMTMGPVLGLLGLVVLLAGAAAIAVARPKPVVLARVSVTS